MPHLGNNALSALTPTGGATGPATSQQIQQAFEDILGRQADPQGLQFFLGDASRGQTIDDIRRSIAVSDEAQQIALGAPPSGLRGFEQAVGGGQRGFEEAVSGGLQSALAQITGGAEQAQARLSPFAEQGGQAFNLQAALSGAAGPEAQAQAFQNFQESPGQQFLQQRGQQALLRGASAIGGLGGGNVRQALVEQGVGFGRQDFGDFFNRLGSLSGIGAQAAGQGAGLSQQAGLAGAQAGLGTSGAIGQARLGTGGQIGQARLGAGQQLAGSLGNLAQQQAALAQQQGGNLANLLSGAGAQGAAGQQNLAQLLANLSAQSSGQIAGLPGIPGVQQQPGILGGIGQAAGGIGTLIGAL